MPRRISGAMLRRLDADGDGYVVMADPEDNEFCFVVDNGGACAAGTRAALGAETHGARG